MTLGRPSFNTDDDHFLIEANKVICGVVSIHLPLQFMVFHIDNWFGDKWLGFEGKILGAFGVSNKSISVIPPFVQNRITTQSLFQRTDDQKYSYSGEGPQIYHQGKSSENFNNHLETNILETALFWVSGNSAINGRGSIMGYVPVKDKYWGWYLELSQLLNWNISKQIGIHNHEIEMLTKQMITLTGLLGQEF